jgi:peptidoglycan/xylan/chitin deacetylase (PgdA/CDA1 family)
MTRHRLRTTSTAAFAALLATGAVVVFRPEWIVAWLASRSPDVLYYVDTDQPIVALTIDDGPDPDTTPPILDLLKRHGAQATFFLIGNRIAGNEDLVARMVREGHELGNHLTTDQPSILLDSAEFERQLQASHRVLAQFAEVHWFRPGSGWYNGAMLSTLEKHGYRCALGSVYPFDPQVPNPSFMAYYVLRNVQPGSIIVLHDHGGRGERTAQALEAILPQLTERGLRVTTLSELVNSTGN